MTNHTKLIKEDPPKPRTGRKPGDISGWLQRVREEGSGDWIKYPRRTDASNASRIKAGTIAGVEPKEFDAAIRQVKDRKGWLYVRYAKVKK